MAEWRFTVRDDGIIDADLGADWLGFAEALNDSVSTRAPQGHTSELSTYWIDRTLDAVGEGSEPRSVIASGNATELVLDEQHIEARSVYELWDDERMAVDDFIDAMRAWRQVTVERLG